MFYQQGELVLGRKKQQWLHLTCTVDIFKSSLFSFEKGKEHLQFFGMKNVVPLHRRMNGEKEKVRVKTREHKG